MADENVQATAQDTTKAVASSAPEAKPQVTESKAMETEPKPSAKVEEKVVEKKDVEAKATKDVSKEGKPDDSAEPVTYDLKIPENAAIDASYVESVVALSKKHGISNEAAQEILNLNNEASAKHASNLWASKVAEFEKVRDSWPELARTDKEIGGDKFGENVELAKRFVERYASDQLKKDLSSTETGYGNHPELIRMFAKAARDFGINNDSLVSSESKPSVRKKTPAEILYGDSSKTNN